MEPKFQSSFIPKGPLASSTGPNLAKRPTNKSLLGVFGVIFFVVSILGAGGVFGYKYYLKGSIEAMQAELETVRAALDSGEIQELTRLHNRIVSTKELLSKHVVITPFFEFLEISAPKLVRFNDFRYAVGLDGIEVTMRGESRGYGALALQAKIFDDSKFFKNSIFSDLSLNQQGDVMFSFRGTLNPSVVSYGKLLEGMTIPEPVPVPAIEPVPGLDTI